jgi:hypothetical protein
MPYLLTSTLLFIAALIIIYWIHNQYHLDIIVEIKPAPTAAPLISICFAAMMLTSAWKALSGQGVT